jgi:transcriptional regulator with XRE-family HTH domain
MSRAHPVGVDDVKVGAVLRAVRIRRGMTQSQVAAEAGVSRSAVSLVERGCLAGTSVRGVRQIAAVLGVSVSIEPRWRGADLARLLDERHAALVQAVVERLASQGWLCRPEHTFSVWGERGSIDVLAWHPVKRALLSVEVKTRLADLQDLLSTMDRKRRLAPALARDLGWNPLVFGSVLVLPEETWARNAVARYGATFAASLPMRTIDVRAWIRRPVGDLRGIWFLLIDAPGSTTRRSGGSMRVRPPRRVPVAADSRSDQHVPGSQAAGEGAHSDRPLA